MSFPGIRKVYLAMGWAVFESLYRFFVVNYMFKHSRSNVRDCQNVGALARGVGSLQ